MISKRAIAEAVLNRLQGGKINRDSKITLRQAMFAVGEARNYAIPVKLNSNKQQYGTFDVPFDILSEYSVKPKYDDDRCSWYVELPVNVLALHKGMGIYSVFKEGFEEEDFIPQIAGEVSLYAGLEASIIEGQKSYYPMEGKLWLANTDFNDKCLSNVILRLVVDSHSLSSSEDFKLDGELEAQVTEMAFQKLLAQVQLPSDNVLNNIDTIQ